MVKARAIHFQVTVHAGDCDAQCGVRWKVPDDSAVGSWTSCQRRAVGQASRWPHVTVVRTDMPKISAILISAENSFYWPQGQILDIQPTSIDKPVGLVSKINVVVWQLKHMFRRATALAGTTGRPTGPYSVVGRRSRTSTKKSVLRVT